MLLEFALPSVRSHAYSGPERRGDVAAQTLRAVMDEIDTTFAREQKATNPRIAKYTKKYHV